MAPGQPISSTNWGLSTSMLVGGRVCLLISSDFIKPFAVLHVPLGSGHPLSPTLHAPTAAVRHDGIHGILAPWAGELQGPAW